VLSRNFSDVVSIHLIPATNGLSVITLDVAFNDGLTYTETSSVDEINFSYTVNCVPDSKADSIDIFSTCKTDEVLCSNCVAQDIIIGAQTWAKCNLDVTTYKDGTPIPEVTDPSAWSALTTGAWCYNNNDSVNGPIYGKLYNWAAVMDPRGLAPVGYHVPTDTEWTTLTTFLGGVTIAGGAMKEAEFCHWTVPNTDATNSSGFSGLPGGLRNYDGSFYILNDYGYWWSTTEFNPSYVWFRGLNDNSGLLYVSYTFKKSGLSVRCIKD
jgi:uncharacterized protein (TIGR02145 family)